jgi:hypothetical protein
LGFPAGLPLPDMACDRAVLLGIQPMIG